MRDDKRLIEDYLPIVAISAEASREKSVRKGHISTLHLWWARRPLVACRAAVYGALVPASRFTPNGASDDKEKSLGRANAARFIERLCKYPGDPKAIAEAQRHILEAHAERLTKETGKCVTVADIEEGRAPRPKVLDMFAGGGAIPLEVLRLGCEAYALDLNPVAHVIELCTLVYPQKYGKPDPTARGMTGPTNAKDEPTWGGLGHEVRYWGEWVLKKVKAEIGDQYPLVPDPSYRKKRGPVKDIFGAEEEIPPGYLVPVAYLWTRTVACKNPSCRATVPLGKQTWLSKKKDRHVALKTIISAKNNRVRFEIQEATSASGMSFDPDQGSEGGSTACPFCKAVADADYVQAQGIEKRTGSQLLAAVCTRPGGRGKTYLAEKDLPNAALPDVDAIHKRIESVCRETGLTVPNEPISSVRPSPNARGLSGVTRHGFMTFGELFSARQLLVVLTFAKWIRAIGNECESSDRMTAIATYCGLTLDKVLSRYSTFSPWDVGYEKIVLAFGKHMLPMVWDYAESVPLEDGSGGWPGSLDDVINTIEAAGDILMPGNCSRGSATKLSSNPDKLDAIITDPPYYDNIPYADISDFFYVWMKRSLGTYHSEHFASQLTPKKTEATALSSRHAGDMTKAKTEYESIMLEAFRQAATALKPAAPLVIVYAHKTTLGWATLVDALRRAGFTVTEAWPLDTEYGGHLKSGTASLSSSIFLVSHKRDGDRTGSYETVVYPKLEAIVRERVDTLWDQGISGADLVIACVGAGLCAFTRFARVEYSNGDEVPSERFLTEVETVVLDSILGRLSKEVGGNGGRTSLAGVDPVTRFYTLWRYTFRGADLDAGEAIIFANGTHVELDGSSGVSSGARALVEKKKGKYRLRDYKERGDDDRLGLPNEGGQAAPLIDALHRTLWLMENRPLKLAAYLREAEPDRDQMRLVAQALAGPALKGGEMADISPTGELAALAKLTSNWRSVVEDNAVTQTEQADKKRGQGKLFE